MMQHSPRVHGTVFSQKVDWNYLLKLDLLHVFFPSLLHCCGEIITGNFKYKDEHAIIKKIDLQIFGGQQDHGREAINLISRILVMQS